MTIEKNVLPLIDGEVICIFFLQTTVSNFYVGKYSLFITKTLLSTSGYLLSAVLTNSKYTSTAANKQTNNSKYTSTAANKQTNNKYTSTAVNKQTNNRYTSTAVNKQTNNR